jgi:Cysteine-rich secretory protein family
MKIFFWVATFLVTFLAVASHRQSSRGVQAFRKPSRLSNQFKPRILNNRKPAKLIKQAQLASKQRARKPSIRKVQRRLLKQMRPQRKSARRYSAFLNECLAGHNRVRRAHNLPYLVLDPFLVQSAQRSANYIASRPNYPLDHNYPELAQAGLGENLTRGYPTCQSAIVPIILHLAYIRMDGLAKYRFTTLYTGQRSMGIIQISSVTGITPSLYGILLGELGVR